ncbi:hypothetical protein FAEPRAA2165_01849 [Faecalibacterium duncaniae]|uniref:Uncharacterized protein n=1 Tax=Faecalibacterium duncaniae (strain DSM 17677 / JCM 31915 / A2-165) TaxID=411483 RepID=C7H6B7_FAED2|nr:hypothetical protein FAEPRAA2165_01849 [Faecalibacterium duncaniae]
MHDICSKRKSSQSFQKSLVNIVQICDNNINDYLDYLRDTSCPAGDLLLPERSCLRTRR